VKRRRPYTDEELKARGMEDWRDDPEMVIADLIEAVRLLVDAVAELERKALLNDRAGSHMGSAAGSADGPAGVPDL
jgi:hypothetical protein